MTALVLAVLALFVLQCMLPPSLRYLLAGPGVVARLRTALGPRDAQPPVPVLGARAERALANMHEALPLFLALALLHLRAPAPPALAHAGALAFLIARCLYVPAYLAGVPGVRSLVWLCGHAGLAAMALALTRVGHAQ